MIKGQIVEETAYEGIFYIEVRNKKTGDIHEYAVHNRIEDQILNALADTLVQSGTVDLEIKYLGIGDDGGTQTTTGQMNNELTRVQSDVDPTRTDTGKVETGFTILDSEANFQIEELGIWVSSAATSTLGTGVLLSRVLWSFLKTQNEEIVVKRIDIIRRG